MADITFDQIPVSQDSFAYQKYIARVGVLDLFCGLDVQGASLGEAAGIVLDIPQQETGENTVADWLQQRSSDYLREGADKYVRHGLDAAPFALSWLENEAFAVLKESGDRTLAQIIVVLAKKVWDQVAGIMVKGIADTAKKAGNAVRELIKDERLILMTVVRALAQFFKDHIAVRIVRVADAARVAVQLAFLAARTCHTVCHNLGAQAFSEGLPRVVSGGVYVGRALLALMNTTQLVNAASHIATEFGVVVAWPARVAASVAHRLLTLIIRLSERLRLGRLIGYAREFAQAHGYGNAGTVGGKFTFPALDAAQRKAHEKEFDAFYTSHIGWFPAAAGLSLLVPSGVGDVWSFLNLGQDERYWLKNGDKVAFNEPRFAQALEEMDNLRTDARVYLNEIGLKFSHTRMSIDKLIKLRAKDNPASPEGFWYYLGLLASHGAGN